MTTPTVSPLTASDRSGSDLLFCAHHAREHESRLREVALTIYDESRRLEATPATASLDER
jgi:hypothetical protein